MRAAIGHEVLAGAIGGASVLGGAFTSPLWAPVVDLGSAVVTAGIAAHAVHSSRGECEGGPSTRDALRRAASEALAGPDAPLAAHVIEAACRARACDSRALRSVAMLVGRCFEMHARGIALGLVGSWSGSLRKVSRVIDATKVARAALANADLVRALHDAALEGDAKPEVETLLPVVPRFTEVPLAYESDEPIETLDDMEEAA